MVKRIVVGAHYGLRGWIAQRATAVYMVLYTVLFAVKVVLLPTLDHENWAGMFAGGFMAFATFLFFLALFYHAWVGMRDIFMDYVKPAGLRLLLHVAVIFALIGYTGWSANILWRLLA